MLLEILFRHQNLCLAVVVSGAPLHTLRLKQVALHLVMAYDGLRQLLRVEHGLVSWFPLWAVEGTRLFVITISLGEEIISLLGTMDRVQVGDIRILLLPQDVPLRALTALIAWTWGAY